MNIDITEIVTAVIGLMSAIITSVIVPMIKAKTTANQQAVLSALARTAVLSAQQLYSAADNQGKKEYAANYVEKLMKRNSLAFDASEISAAIEAALKEIKTTAPGEAW